MIQRLLNYLLKVLWAVLMAWEIPWMGARKSVSLMFVNDLAADESVGMNFEL